MSCVAPHFLLFFMAIFFALCLIKTFITLMGGHKSEKMQKKSHLLKLKDYYWARSNFVRPNVRVSYDYYYLQWRGCFGGVSHQ